ncbi:MAG: bifunctional 4-hydroxy-2-oxoglutarate aldolase/2-dehydro-3-deoxy-phosphogluconate aldolase [Nocardioidaceae bacterium]|nr:bifunctional 4-hydroxy-2-oxoglutarate aldolase/2-dehydro-3-deoxy-phosphogluconate aldolase [Nocardioidaceae bacterium]
MMGAGMPACPPEKMLDRIAQIGVIVVIRSATKADALRVSRVLLGAGVKALEVTYTTPDASKVITTLRRETSGEVLVGAGTIRSVDDSLRAAESGADFLVSPGSPPRLIEAMLATGRLVLPGVLTPTEVMHARSLGVSAVKLFPAALVGPNGLRALLGPFPDVAFVPTGGITMDEVVTWLDAGAHAVGLGSTLAPASLSGDIPAQELALRVHRFLGDALGGPQLRASRTRG